MTKVTKKWKVMGRFSPSDDFEGGYFDDLTGSKTDCSAIVRCWVAVFRKCPMKFRNGNSDGMIFEWGDFEWKLEKVKT